MEVPLNINQLEWNDFVNNIDQLEYIDQIGRGSFGNVVKYYYKKNKKYVVSKQSIFHQTNTKSQAIGLPRDVVREITI